MVIDVLKAGNQVAEYGCDFNFYMLIFSNTEYYKTSFKKQHMILSQLFDALFLKYIQRKFSEILEKQILLQKKTPIIDRRVV